METALQELIEFINSGNDIGYIRVKATALMEKEKKDINNAYFNGWQDCSSTELDYQDDDFTEEQTDKYYKETFLK